VLYQIYFALDLGALKSVMVMFTSSGSDRRSDTLLEFYGFVERWARVL